jgi:hypothetical protein
MTSFKNAASIELKNLACIYDDSEIQVLQILHR